MATAVAAERTYSWLVHLDQWARCAHEGTALLPDGTIELDWTDDAASAAPGTAADRDGTTHRDHCEHGTENGCLAFDSWLRAYRSRPALDRVDVLPAGAGGRRDDPGGRRGALRRPTALAVDRLQRLHVIEAGAGAVRVIDLVGGHLLRRVAVPRGHPVDVAPDCGHALVLVRSRHQGRLLVLDGSRGARPGPELVRPCYPRGLAPHRIASARTEFISLCPLVLWRADDGRCAIATPDGATLAVLDGATDLDLGPDGRVVVGFGAGRPIRDYQVEGDTLTEREPLLAPDFDGGAVAIAPNGRVAFTTSHGYAWTAGTAARRITSGRVVSYRLDSQAYRTRWGRVFVDACLPHGTSLAMRFVTTDADDVLDPIPATPPRRGARAVPALPDPPPLAPAHLLDAVTRDGEAHLPYRRPNGPESPWPLPGSTTRLQTYELPVYGPPGRYLWIELLLRGTTRVSPTLGPLRVERPGHRLLNALPRSWSRREDDAAFLQRLLAPAEGLLHEIDRRAAERAALVDPRSTPSEALDWLCSFAALSVDRRWPEESRRRLLAEIYPLFRRRGTEACLLRMVEHYLGVPPTLIETWRLRGRAGPVLGTAPTTLPDEVVGGAGSRGSALGRFAIGGQDASPAQPVSPPDIGLERASNRIIGRVAVTPRPATSYDATAHRFTILIPGRLSDEQHQVITDLLDRHRPAHTMVEICELGEGMRIGSLRLAYTAYVGPAPEPRPLVVGRTGVGVDAAFGSPVPGSRLDPGARVGQVRLG